MGAIEPVPDELRAALAARVIDHLPVLVAYYDPVHLRCRFANVPYTQRFGFDQTSIVGSTLAEVVGEEAMREIQPHLDRMWETLRPVVYERKWMAADGSRRWTEVHLLPHLADAGPAEALGISVLISDITKYRLADEAARESEERLSKFMQASAEGIVFQEGGLIVDANPALSQLSGYSLQELVGRRTLELVAPDEVAKAAASIASGAATQFESAIIDRQGRRIPVEFIGRSMQRHGETVRMSIVRDIRDRQAVQARIHHLAHHDALTGLANRMSLVERLQDSIAGSRAANSQLALLFIDLDHFKRVNDSLGHPAGDTLLRTVAARLTSSLRESDLVARWGGDEFVVLLSERRGGPQHAVDVEEVAAKLIASVGATLSVEGRMISVTPSVGIAIFPNDGSTPEELVKSADSAMYLAKSRGRANFQFFDARLAAAALDALVLESELAEALQRREFELYYQPQVDAKDGQVLGAEALIRWNHPTRGLLGADAFIPVAEERQLMLPIGQWVLREALLCALRWRAMGFGLGPIAVNLSNIQFQSIGFVEAVAEVLPAAGIDAAGGGAGLIELELTERMLMDDLAQVKPRLARLKAMGLQISIDDFGTGYSSLGHLKELPIDKLKIDRSFVVDLPEDRSAAAIIRAIIQMGQSLAMTVVAEGVETEAQRLFLAAQGCDQLQGLLISAPMPQAEFEAWLRQKGPPPLTIPSSPAASSPPAIPASRAPR